METGEVISSQLSNVNGLTHVWNARNVQRLTKIIATSFELLYRQLGRLHGQGAQTHKPVWVGENCLSQVIVQDPTQIQGVICLSLSANRNTVHICVYGIYIYMWIIQPRYMRIHTGACAVLMSKKNNRTIRRL